MTVAAFDRLVNQQHQNSLRFTAHVRTDQADGTRALEMLVPEKMTYFSDAQKDALTMAITTKFVYDDPNGRHR